MKGIYISEKTIGIFQKNQKAVLYLSLAFMVFLSGCVDSGRTKTEIVSKDMLKIKSIDVFPSKDLQPGDTIIIRMDVENAGQESTYLLVDKDANTPSTSKALNPKWNGDYLLIDHCPSLYNANPKDAEFQILSGGSCTKQLYTDTTYTTPAIPLVKDSAGNEIGVLKDGDDKIIKDASGKARTACYLKIPPGQSHTFQWSMKAPSSDMIADMTHKCTFKFQTAYAAKAVTNTYVYFADPVEVAQRMYTQKDMTQVGDNIASYGPVAVNFVPAEPQPIPAKTGGVWTVFLNMMNVGEGIANVNDLKISLESTPKANAGLMTSGCRMIGDIKKDLELVEAMNASESADAELITALKNFADCEPKTPPCTQELKTLANTAYTTYCNIKSPDEKCGKKLSEMEASLKEELKSAKQQLQIYSQKSSRIPCELTIPKGITILSPFRFVTTADYTYSIRQDIQITTKPIRARA